jgi:hypothetical protein
MPDSPTFLVDTNIFYGICLEHISGQNLRGGDFFPERLPKLKCDALISLKCNVKGLEIFFGD